MDASGLSDFNITANKKLVLDASGSSDGKYKGTPASKVISVTAVFLSPHVGKSIVKSFIL